jgi:hypothetical protein
MTMMTAVVVSHPVVIPVALPALILMIDPEIPVPMIVRIRKIGTAVTRIAMAARIGTARPRIATVVIPQIVTAAQTGTAREPLIATEVILPIINLPIGTEKRLPETDMETRTDLPEKILPIAMEVILRIVMEIIIQTGIIMIGVTEILEKIRVPGIIIAKIRVMPKRNFPPPLRFLQISFLEMNELIILEVLQLQIVLLALNQYLLHNIITEMNLK